MNFYTTAHQQMDRLFLIIGRINSILFLLVLIGAAASIAWITAESNQWKRRGAVEVSNAESSEPKSVLLNFERLENITGADTQLMRLTTQERAGKFSSGGYGTETRNIVFLTGTEKVARWLFKEHKNLILVTAQLGTESGDRKENPTRALYFEYVSNDTNQDGVLSSTDHSSIGLTRPDGTAFVEVLNGLSRALSYEMLDDKSLSVVYQKGNSVRRTIFSLSDMKPVSDRKIMDVPNAL